MRTAVCIMDAAGIRQCLEDLAAQVAAKAPAAGKLAVIGIQRRGVFLASRLAALLEKKLGQAVPQGALDINLYRDDWTTLGQQPVVGRTDLNFDVRGMNLLLVDDVLFTGRTIRAALEALTDFGRPNKVELLALIDRGHRELPIQPDYAGLTLKTERSERVDVMLRELDGGDEAVLRKS
ncbi:MAG: bifunctional pyr operon transcriptional regulator/uracil phosphoribosyltransferase PyrR [Deltaproteobacteria bacterium]|nr:bifunctional pyr operon transcriptional regulator/uracil phosphoribosyltransferase PyrR [Deltaproteobacteria bacterium]